MSSLLLTAPTLQRLLQSLKPVKSFCPKTSLLSKKRGKPVGIDKADPAYEDAKKEMKARQKEFAKTLASYADVYVNDAFGTAHRKHASTAVIADYFSADDKMLGYLMEKEVKAVDNILSDIKRPFTAIMGGFRYLPKSVLSRILWDKVDNPLSSAAAHDIYLDC